MSPIQRIIDGQVLVHHLMRDEQLIDATLVAEHGRSARTIAKEGQLRLTIIALAAGGTLPSHHTNGPVTIQMLEGEVVFDALDETYTLVTGDLLVLATGVEHSARSAAGGRFLLTVVHAPSAGSRSDDA